MCGTPVVAFDVGVARDLVRNEQTGYIAKWNDGEDLANKIEKLLKQPQNIQKIMARNCRSMAVSNYGVKAHTMQLVKLIEKTK